MREFNDKWINYFLGMAKASSVNSNCIRAQVGCVIVDPNTFHIKSTGYNGTPSGITSCKEIGSCYRIDNDIPSGTQYETCRSLHAEQNAIIQAGEEDCRDGVMFLYGHSYCCVMCRRFIIQSGISKVYVKRDDNSEIVLFTAEELRKGL